MLEKSLSPSDICFPPYQNRKADTTITADTVEPNARLEVSPIHFIPQDKDFTSIHQPKTI